MICNEKIVFINMWRHEDECVCNHPETNGEGCDNCSHKMYAHKALPLEP